MLKLFAEKLHIINYGTRSGTFKKTAKWKNIFAPTTRQGFFRSNKFF